MSATVRLFCAAAISVAFSLVAAAETLVLDVADARVAADGRTHAPVVTIRLAQPSVQPFAAFTTARTGNKMELRVDGKLIADPVIREPITGGTLQVSLDAQPDTARAIAEPLRKPGAKIEAGGD